MFDLFGVALLTGLALGFAVLTWRATRAARRLLKWVGAPIAGLLTLASGVLLCAALFGYWQLNRGYDNPVPDLTVALTPERLARGERLSHLCAGCHAPDSAEAMIGRDFLGADAPPIGTFYAPNLTPRHLAEWSDGEIVRAIREGVHPSGRSLLIMPSRAWRNLGDEDVYSIVAYLRSLPAQGAVTPPNRLNVLGAVLSLTLPLREAQPPITQPVRTPPPGRSAAYGAYVSSFTCQLCHGTDLLGDPDVPSPPLVTIGTAWTEGEFIQFMRTGVRPNGTAVDGEIMPWSDLSRILAEDDELRGVYAHLVQVAQDFAGAEPGAAAPNTGITLTDSSRLAVPGGSVWYRVTGTGSGTPVILLHGGPGFSSFYLKNLEALGDDRPVIRYDQLGSGKSDPMSDTTFFTVERFVDQLEALRAHLGLERFHLYGHSWGTMLGVEYYRAHPERVASLVLASAALDAPAWARHARQLVGTLPDSMIRAVETREAEQNYQAADYQAALEEFYNRYVWRRPVAADLDSLMSTYNPAIYEYMWGPSEFTATGTLMNFDAKPLLGTIGVPVLYTVGEFDEAGPENIEMFANLTPGSRMVVIPGAAHITGWDNPEADLAAVRAFLREVDGG